MNTLQTPGTTTHELTQNTAGQSQPRDSHGHITAANAMEYTNAKQTLIHGQDIGINKRTLANTYMYKECHWPDYLLATTLYIHRLNHKRYITHQTLADGQNTNTACKRDKLLGINYVKFHLTIYNHYSNITVNIEIFSMLHTECLWHCWSFRSSV